MDRKRTTLTPLYKWGKLQGYWDRFWARTSARWLEIHLFIYSSIHPAIHPPSHLSSQSSIHPSIHPPTHPPIHHLPHQSSSHPPILCQALGLTAGRQRWLQLSKNSQSGRLSESYRYGGGLCSPQHFRISFFPHEQSGDKQRHLVANSFRWVGDVGTTASDRHSEEHGHPANSCRSAE